MFNALGTLGGVSPRSTERIATVANAVTALAIPPGVLSLNLFNSGTYHLYIYIYIYFFTRQTQRKTQRSWRRLLQRRLLQRSVAQKPRLKLLTIS